jgi:predicted 2-oxoglutarate/Fe(II)-dependent dioxygenase YbiX
VGTGRALGVGERAPDFVLRGEDGAASRFYAVAGGRPTALAFVRDVASPLLTEVATLLAEREDLAMYVVADATVAGTYGVDLAEPAVLVLDPDLRVTDVLPGDVPGLDLVALLDAAAHRGLPTEVADQAPVLFVPRVVDAALRDRLIRRLEDDGGIATGVERSAAEGRGEVLDAAYKRRRDHTVEDPDLLRELSTVVGRRVMPEIRKAFAFRATRFEGFKIACYEASTGGFFRAHRDNLSASTAHRVFALTLNLNDEYAGGQLRFPEYGNQLYRPDAGAALVFSCAHLHEVLDVTEGRRFVLLSFLYGDPLPASS